MATAPTSATGCSDRTMVSNTVNNYGAWQFPEKLIPLIILNALEGKPLPVYGDGSNQRDWLFRSDDGQQHREQLRRLAVPGEADPADHPERAGGQAFARLWRRLQPARLAVQIGRWSATP